MLPAVGPPPIVALQRPDESSLVLRLNQRITAEVLQIATDHVVLMLDGAQVVARLTSAEQAAALAERRTAQFVVRGFADQVLTLQLAVQPQAAAPNAPLAQPSQWVFGLLQQANLPADQATAHIALALVNRGLPVTPELVQELGAALAGLKNWGQAEAQTAAALKAAGLPLSPGALALVLSASASNADLLARVEAQLRTLSGPALSPRLAELTQNALQVLSRLKVDWSAPPQTVAAQLREVVETMGRSLEKDLARLAADGAKLQDLAPQKGLLALAQLRGELAGSPALQGLLGDLDRFLDSARLNQLMNVAPERAPAEGHWLRVNVPLGQPAPGHAPAEDAHLRVAYRPGGAADQIDSMHTRLVLQVDLEDGQCLEVDLAVVERQIGARVTATSPELRDLAQGELSELEAGLRELGYALKTARCEVGRPLPSSLGDALSSAALTPAPDEPGPRVDMEA